SKSWQAARETQQRRPGTSAADIVLPGKLNRKSLRVNPSFAQLRIQLQSLLGFLRVVQGGALQPCSDSPSVGGRLCSSRSVAGCTVQLNTPALGRAGRWRAAVKRAGLYRSAFRRGGDREGRKWLRRAGGGGERVRQVRQETRA